LMKKVEIPDIPLILGLILGFMAEDNLRRTLKLSGGNLNILLERPLAVSLLFIAAVLFMVPLFHRMRMRARGGIHD